MNNQPQVVNLSAASPADVAASARAARAARAAARPAAPSAFWPVLLCALTLLGWFAFQALQLLADRETLLATRQGQQQTVDNAGKLRTSLDALAADTQRMADAGNPNAALLVAELRKRGITITVPAAAAPSADTAPAAVPR